LPGFFFDWLVVADHPPQIRNDNMGIKPKDTIAQVFGESCHHRKSDIQGHHANHYPNGRNESDQRNERLAPSRAQITEADEEFVTHEQLANSV
jgi:hypothetical protein